MMWWMDVCDILFCKNVVLWNPMSIALHYNSVTINPKYRCENVYCHFYGMLIYFTLYGLCLANEWNVFINSQNDIMKSIKNLKTYKKNSPILAMKKSSCYRVWESILLQISSKDEGTRIPILEIGGDVDTRVQEVIPWPLTICTTFCPIRTTHDRKAKGWL
jgi:hypothetical protein